MCLAAESAESCWKEARYKALSLWEAGNWSKQVKKKGKKEAQAHVEIFIFIYFVL